jgi:hypothetical protein
MLTINSPWGVVVSHQASARDRNLAPLALTVWRRLRRSPGAPCSARPYVLAHLLIILLLEPLIDEFEDSPRLLAAA